MPFRGSERLGQGESRNEGGGGGGGGQRDSGRGI